MPEVAWDKVREEQQLNREGFFFKHERHLSTIMCLGEGASEWGEVTGRRKCRSSEGDLKESLDSIPSPLQKMKIV